MIQQVQQHLSSVEAYEQLSASFQKVPGFLDPKEGFAFFLLALLGPAKGEIVEIGSFMGRSTCFLASGAKMAQRRKVIAIDHFTGSPEHQKGASHEVADIATHGTTFDRFRANLLETALWDQVEVMKMSSVEAAADWSLPIALLFIDGDHSYVATRQDFDAFSRFVVPGGLVCLHDVGVWPGVTTFYKELVSAGDSWTSKFTINSLAVLSRVGS